MTNTAKMTKMTKMTKTFDRYYRKKKRNLIRDTKTEFKRLQKLKKHEKLYDEAVAIVQELEHDKYYCSYELYPSQQPNLATFTITIHVPAEESVKEGVNNIMDIAEFVLQDSGFILNTNKTKQKGSFYVVVYNHESLGEIIIDIYIATSNTCKQKKVEKTVQETVYICEEEEL